jgi:hypothetical protein
MKPTGTGFTAPLATEEEIAAGRFFENVDQFKAANAAERKDFNMTDQPTPDPKKVTDAISAGDSASTPLTAVSAR